MTADDVRAGEAIDAVLVVNCRSSSIKSQFLAMDHERGLAVGVPEQIAEARAQLRHQGSAGAHACEVEARDHREGFRHIGAALRYDLPPGELVAIGHRVVHGGERLRAPTPIDAPAREAIRELLVRADDENAHRRAGPAHLRERPARPRVPRPIERDPELLQARARELQIARETLATVRPAPPG